MTAIRHNGKACDLPGSPNSVLLYALRSAGNDPSVRFGCGTGHCGACTVLIDGQAENACTLALWAAEQHEVTTAQGLARDPVGQVVLQAFLDEQAAQCGYCINGIMLRITGLLTKSPAASIGQVREALARHLCRCGAHTRILRAVALAQQRLNAKD